jgi:hypothetical protein
MIECNGINTMMGENETENRIWKRVHCADKKKKHKVAKVLFLSFFFLLDSKWTKNQGELVLCL